jgi:predicted XRE-type DNA-binding protein
MIATIRRSRNDRQNRYRDQQRQRVRRSRDARCRPHLLKADLLRRIEGIIRQRRLTQAQAAELLGLSQPDVSRLLRGSFLDYSMERLPRLLTALGRDVEIVIRKPRKNGPGKLTVEAAE